MVKRKYSKRRTSKRKYFKTGGQTCKNITVCNNVDGSYTVTPLSSPPPPLPPRPSSPPPTLPQPPPLPPQPYQLSQNPPDSSTSARFLDMAKGALNEQAKGKFNDVLAEMATKQAKDKIGPENLKKLKNLSAAAAAASKGGSRRRRRGARRGGSRQSRRVRRRQKSKRRHRRKQKKTRHRS